MYKRVKTYISSSEVSPDRFIESINDIPDYANSTLLYKLDEEDTRSEYTITKYERRIDLIANEIYGNEKYSWILMYLNRVTVNELVRGKVLEYIPMTTLENILRSI